MADETSWHLDKRIPVALILGLIGQTMVFAFWVGGIDNQVGVHDTAIARLQQVDSSRSGEMVRVEGRLSSLEATSQAQLETLRRIERLLEPPR